MGVRTPPGVFVWSCELAQARRFAQGEAFCDGDSIADLLRVLSVFDFLALANRAPAFFNASKFSACCVRSNGIFDRKRSRSLVHAGLLATTPIAADPPNPSPNYPTDGLTPVAMCSRRAMSRRRSARRVALERLATCRRDLGRERKTRPSQDRLMGRSFGVDERRIPLDRDRYRTRQHLIAQVEPAGIVGDPSSAHSVSLSTTFLRTADQDADAGHCRSTIVSLSTHIPMASYLGEGSWIEFNNHARSARPARRRAARSWALHPAATKRIRC